MNYQPLRNRMVDSTIVSRGIRDNRVIDVMRRIPRHEFVRGFSPEEVYGDHPLKIGYGQTISQPYIVALMTELLGLEKSHRVLEIGTGSGYQTAILAELSDTVFSIERIEGLVERARVLLSGYTNVHLMKGNGYGGWPDEAPFEAIILTASPEHLPEALVSQLTPGGVIVAPTGSESQELSRYRRNGVHLEKEFVTRVRFVPLVDG